MQYQNILLIDDDPDDQLVFRTALNSVVPTVDYAAFADAAVALQKLLAKEVAVDIIFLDLNLPTMGAKEFVTEARQDSHLREIPIIVLSSAYDLGKIEEIKLSGAREFHRKPNTFSELEEILKNILFP
jgi:CheY-like chemotaxis protein